MVGATAIALAMLGTPDVRADDGPGLSFGIGPAIEFAPLYPGADRSGISPGAVFELKALRLGGAMLSQSDGWFDPDGTGVRGSFRMLGSRLARDNPELQGLEDLDRALELGAGVYHKTRDYQAYVDLRHGVMGHRGWVGEAGIDLFVRPAEGLTLAAGPRMGFADGGYMRQYFGITAAESAASGLAVHRPGSGIYSAGVGVRAVYELGPDWAILGGVGFDRLTRGAADSPITRQGSRNQLSVTLGVGRVLRFN